MARTLADFSRVPASLRSLPQWLVWKLESREKKPTKVPYCAADPSRRASSTDPATWAAFDQAVSALERGGVDGIGFVFAGGGGIVGIDLDKCVAGGIVEPWAQAIIDAIGGYAELSPSGTGVHIIALGKLPEGRRRKGKIETYESGRYFTVSGNVLPGSSEDVTDRQDAINSFHAEYLGAETMPKSTPPRPMADGFTGPDSDLIDRAKMAKNGAKFCRLWRGDASDYKGDMSSATLGLCTMLAFWTGRDPSRIDALIRQSGMMRDKWDSRRGESTWGADSIRWACAACREVFTPGMTEEAVEAYLDAMNESSLIGGKPYAATTPPLREPGADEDADAEPVVTPATAAIVEAAIEPTQTATKPANRPYITNMLETPGDDGQHVNAYVPVQKMAGTLVDGLGGWPKSSGGRMFVRSVVKSRRMDELPTARNVRFLSNTNSLAAWIHEHADIHFAKATHAVKGVRKVSLISKPEFFESITNFVDRYDGVEMLPHHPPVEDVFYWPCPLPKSNGLALAELLDNLNPETEIDRSLMLAALLTPGWGGPAGARPAFVISSASGRGAGKTSTAELFARIWGGAVSIGEDEDWQQVTTRLLSDESFTSRVGLIDNIKGRMSRGGLEAAITAATINGRRLYVGQASRPNLMTWYITANTPELSRDLAERSVVIKVGAPRHGSDFAAWSNHFLKTNRAAVISDLIATLSQPAQSEVPREYSDRWRTWQQAVLTRLPNGGELAAHIIAARGEVDADSGTAEELVSAIRAMLDQGGYNPDDSTVIIKPKDLHERLVFEGHRSKSDHQRSTTAWLKHQMDVEPMKSRMVYRQVKMGGQNQRAWIWTGENATPDDAALVFAPVGGSGYAPQPR